MRITLLRVGFALLSMAACSAMWPFRCNDCERDNHGKIKRNAAAVKAFKRANPQPAECKAKGVKCVVDHIVPIACATSPETQRQLDSAANMQWQTGAAGKMKDRWELELCRLNTGQRIALGRRYGQAIPRKIAEIGAKP